MLDHDGNLEDHPHYAKTNTQVICWVKRGVMETTHNRQEQTHK